MSAFEWRLRVRSYELDALGHVNHSVYLNYFEQARFEALEEAGRRPHRAADGGWGVVVARIEVDYLEECRQGDRLRIVTRAESFRRTSMVLAQELFVTSDGEGVSRADGPPGSRGGAPEALAARARVTAVWLGSGGRPTRIPDEVRSAFGHRGGDPDTKGEEG